MVPTEMLTASHELQSIADVQKAITDGRTTVKAIVEQHLKAIEELNPKLNAVIYTNKHALDDAEKLDVRNELLKPVVNA